MTRGLLLAAAIALIASPVTAQDTSGAPGSARESSPVQLGTYLDALAERRLLAEETGSAERLEALVRQGEQFFFDGRHDAAATALFEVAESPQFADFMSLDSFRGAEFILARALEELGAQRTAQRYLLRILSRGPDDLYFGPAYRKMVDVTLASGDLAGGIERLEDVDEDLLPEDSENELRYLRGRLHYDAEENVEADDLFGEITQRSRWYAPAQYLRGALAARAGNLDEAEEMFCSVADAGEENRFSFYVDDRFFDVQDLARLGLGRVAHEGQRAEDAFYYYFQVPNDSDRVAEALFEAAYSMYEGGDHETATDLLDQLEARFPETSFADEAKLLRGYVHLGRCEFQEASELFVKFQNVFGPVRNEVRRILENPARQERLYQELLEEERRLEASRESRRGDEEPLASSDGEEDSGRQPTTRGLLLAMLRVDPGFFRLHRDVRTLEAEAARSGRLRADLEAIGARVAGGDRPRAAAEAEEQFDETGELRQDFAGAQAVLASITEQVDAMRGDAESDQLRPIESEVRGLSQRLRSLENQLDQTLSESTDQSAGTESGSETEIETLLARDAAYAGRLPGRVAEGRRNLVEAANDAALRAVRDLDARLGSGLRRARIGRIDAVMGSKRRIEIQIESLAAGRFPPELQDPLRVQGLLRDDEEFWPFEGEYWSDEFDETDPVSDLLEEDDE